MNAEPPAPPEGDELARVARELYDALSAARPYVWGRSSFAQPSKAVWETHEAADLLDRVDAALADAGDVLAQVTT